MADINIGEITSKWRFGLQAVGGGDLDLHTHMCSFITILSRILQSRVKMKIKTKVCSKKDESRVKKKRKGYE